MNITPILVAVDFSSTSAAALRCALRLSRSFERTLRAVHVVDVAVAFEIERELSDYVATLRESLLDDARRAWRAFASSVPGAEALPFDVELGSRARSIVQMVERQQAEFLILGAVGERRPSVGMGTIATTCARHAPCDVLLVREGPDAPFQRILVAVDFSPASARALERCTALAGFEGAQLHVVHMFDAPWHRLHYRAPTTLASPADQARFRAALLSRLEGFAEPAVRKLGPACVKVDLVDTPSHRSGIVEHAERIGADLIAVGTRGHFNVRDFFLGSTAEKVLAESTCSVLAVRA